MQQDWKVWLKAALVRAVKTFAQTAAASITVGAAVEDIQWLHVLSVSGVAFVLSILTSLGGLPEVEAAASRAKAERTDPPDAES